MKWADCTDSFHLIHTNKEGIPKPENDLKDILLFTLKAKHDAAREGEKLVKRGSHRFNGAAALCLQSYFSVVPTVKVLKFSQNIQQ